MKGVFGKLLSPPWKVIVPPLESYCPPLFLVAVTKNIKIPYKIGRFYAFGGGRVRPSRNKKAVAGCDAVCVGGSSLNGSKNPLRIVARGCFFSFSLLFCLSPVLSSSFWRLLFLLLWRPFLPPCVQVVAYDRGRLLVQTQHIGL